MSFFASLFGRGKEEPESNLFSTSSIFKRGSDQAVGSNAQPASKLNKDDASDGKPGKAQSRSSAAKTKAAVKSQPKTATAKTTAGSKKADADNKAARSNQASSVAAAAAKRKSSQSQTEGDNQAQKQVKKAKTSSVKGNRAGSKKGSQEKSGGGAGAKKKQKREAAPPSDEDASDQEEQEEEVEEVSVDDAVDSDSGSEGEDGSEKAVEKLRRTIFVGNISLAVTRKALAKHFSKFGKVDSVRLRSIPVKLDAKMPRKAAVVSGNVDGTRGTAHGYVVFAEESAAKEALALNMTELQGLHIRVDVAAGNTLKTRPTKEAPKGTSTLPDDAVHKVTYDPSRSVFCGNLHINLEDEELIRFFIDALSTEFKTPDGLPPVEAVRIVRDQKTSTGKGIGFVLLRTPAARKAALSLDGRQLKGRPIRITPVKKDGAVTGKKVASWQGMAASKSGRVRAGGGKDFKGDGEGRKKGGVKKVEGKRKAGGKRPSVVRRKAKQLSTKGRK